MQYIIKDLETKTETTYDIRDIMLGSTTGDNRDIVFLTDGSAFVLNPASRYEVSRFIEEEQVEPIIPTLKQSKESKLQSLSYTCNQIITAGCDVTLSDGIEGHISLQDTDQTEILSVLEEVKSGAETAPYHLDDSICKRYPADDIITIATAARQHITFHRTFYNHLKQWILRCETIEEVNSITYESALPEDLLANMNEVLGIE